MPQCSRLHHGHGDALPRFRGCECTLEGDVGYALRYLVWQMKPTAWFLCSLVLAFAFLSVADVLLPGSGEAVKIEIYGRQCFKVVSAVGLALGCAGWLGVRLAR